MRSRKLLAVVVASALGLAIPVASAFAASISQTGTVTGAAESVVTLKVVTKGGKPAKVTSFSVQNLPVHCDGGAGQLNASFAKSLTVAKDGSFSGEIVQSSGPGGFFKLSGKVTNGGKKVSGKLSLDKSFSPPQGECKANNKKWSTRSG